MDVSIGEGRPYNKNGYLIMPSTYDSKIQGTFIVSVKCDRPFEIASSKWIKEWIEKQSIWRCYMFVLFEKINK